MDVEGTPSEEAITNGQSFSTRIYAISATHPVPFRFSAASSRREERCVDVNDDETTRSGSKVDGDSGQDDAAEESGTNNNVPASNLFPSPPTRNTWRQLAFVRLSALGSRRRVVR